MVALVGLASIEGEPDDLVNRMGFAVDSWKARPFNTMTDAFSSAPLPNLFNGIDAELASSRGDARRALEQGAVSVNGERARPGRVIGKDDLLHGRYVVLRKGKKSYAVLVREGG